MNNYRKSKLSTKITITCGYSENNCTKSNAPQHRNLRAKTKLANANHKKANFNYGDKNKSPTKTLTLNLKDLTTSISKTLNLEKQKILQFQQSPAFQMIHKIQGTTPQYLGDDQKLIWKVNSGKTGIISLNETVVTIT